LPRGTVDFSDLKLYADIFLWTTDAILRVDNSLFSRGEGWRDGRGNKSTAPFAVFGPKCISFLFL
jgi:hypothetical protein